MYLLKLFLKIQKIEVKKGNMNRQAGINGVMKQDEQKKSDKGKKITKLCLPQTNQQFNKPSKFFTCILDVHWFAKSSQIKSACYLR